MILLGGVHGFDHVLQSLGLFRDSCNDLVLQRGLRVVDMLSHRLGPRFPVTRVLRRIVHAVEERLFDDVSFPEEELFHLNDQEVGVISILFNNSTHYLLISISHQGNDKVEQGQHQKHCSKGEQNLRQAGREVGIKLSKRQEVTLHGLIHHSFEESIRFLVKEVNDCVGCGKSENTTEEDDHEGSHGQDYSYHQVDEHPCLLETSQL